MVQLTDISNVELKLLLLSSFYFGLLNVLYFYLKEIFPFQWSFLCLCICIYDSLQTNKLNLVVLRRSIVGGYSFTCLEYTTRRLFLVKVLYCRHTFRVNVEQLIGVYVTRG